MRKSVLLIILSLLLIWPVAMVQAATPPDEPPGLQRAIEVKERHEGALLGIQGVAGVAVGVGGDGRAAIITFIETARVQGLPASLEDVPVIPRVSGRFLALPKPEGAGKPPKEPAPDPTT